MGHPIIRTTKAKAIAAAAGSLLTVVAATFADDVLDSGEVGGLVAGLVTAAVTVYAVYRTPNRPA